MIIVAAYLEEFAMRPTKPRTISGHRQYRLPRKRRTNEHGPPIAAHEFARTTKLYARTSDEIERIAI